MARKIHEYQLTDKALRHIEYVLPKLKYSVYVQQIKSWLENFEEDETNLALDFLFYLEYIPFPELQLRLNNQLKELMYKSKKETSFLLLPFAKYPKSSDIILYLISKCPVYKELEKDGRIQITLDIENYQFEKETMLVFVDDFIGTGKSFKKWYNKNKINNIIGANINVVENQVIISAIIMEDGFNFLKYCFPNIEIFSEYRSKVFDKNYSPFNISSNRAEMKRLCLKYGLNIPTIYNYKTKTNHTALGFDKSEALVAFDYGTPNNTLSLIWGHQNWNPIFPRAAESRMKKASVIKSEAAFYLGIMNKLEISLDEDIDVNLSKSTLHLSARDDHSILVYLILTHRHSKPLLICQTLGITITELNKIVHSAYMLKMVTKDGAITTKGIELIEKIKKLNNIHNFRKNDKLEIRKKYIFVPKSFRNLT